MSQDVDLSAVSTAVLELVQRQLKHRQTEAPLSAAELDSWGVGETASVLAGVLNGLPSAARLPMLQGILSERHAWRTPNLEFVWTGLTLKHSEARVTRARLKHLFQSARRSVLLVGFAFDHGEEIFEPLHASMAAHGVEAEFFVDLKQGAGAPPISEREAQSHIKSFLAENWPFGAPFPRFFVDDRVLRGGVYTSIHAKLVVVDERQTFITSANFTSRAMERNLEAGVFIDDVNFAKTVVSQFRQAVGVEDGFVELL